MKYAFLFALGLLALEVFYLLAANALLASNLIRSAVGSAEGLHLKYSSARSWLPGRVQVHDFDLRIEDYDVQAELEIGLASIDVELLDLLFKRFHAVRLRADNLAFRFRHKVHKVGENGLRLKNYPPIAGFSNPPLYHGPPPLPTANPESLWSVQIENIVARTRRLWILEYRFQGDAEARGSFSFRPALFVRAEPASLRLNSGTLHVGQDTVANAMQGRISFAMPRCDIRSAQGRQLFRNMSGHAEVKLTGGTLDFLDVYTEPQASVLFHGPARWSVIYNVRRGVITEPSKVELHTRRFVVGTSRIKLQGVADVSLSRKPDTSALLLDAVVKDAALILPRPCSKPPQLAQLTSSVQFEGVDLSRAMTLGNLTVTGTAHAPELACINPLLRDGALQLGGSADASVQLDREPSGNGAGSAWLELSNGHVEHRNDEFRGDVHATAKFRLARTVNDSNYAQGAVSLRLTSAGSLLSFAMSRLFRNLVSGVLGLDQLQATVAFHAERHDLRLELTSARSGAVTGKGHWQLGERGGPAGAVLLSSGPINVGVTLDGSKIRVSPFVASDWLSSRSETSRCSH